VTIKASPGKSYLEDLSWEEKARQNPLYGVMSVDEFASAGSEPTSDQLERFFAAGVEKVNAWILPWLTATGTAPTASILEFGCGMGRLVRAVQASYGNVAGVDISPTMVQRAAILVPGARFIPLTEQGKISLPSASVDRAYSYAVFQHINRWSAIKSALAEIGRVMKPGGYAKLQFEMPFPPEFASVTRLRARTYAFENSSVVYGWARRFGLPVPGIKLLAHNNWQGARPGYGQLVRHLSNCGLTVYGMECNVHTPHLVWFLTYKTSGMSSRQSTSAQSRNID
jgi:ubiquinone/menaquinone biosynthesis C-methylase UbiE